MTVAPNEVEQVVQAVRAVQDGNTPNAERNKFTQALEQLKDGPPGQSIGTAFALLSNADRSVAHVGLNIVEHVIKYKWHEMSVEEKLSVKNGIFGWISAGNYSVTALDMHIKTAASRVVVTMMEHEWPENWPELMPQFTEIVENPKLVPQCHMVFLIMRRLIEDVLTLITVQNYARRKDLQNAINANIGLIIRLAVGRLVVCVNDGAKQDSVLLAKSAMELLSEIFDWVSGKDLGPFVDEVVDVLALYLQQDLCRIFETAASSLHKLASRKRQKTDELQVAVSMFRDGPMQSILAACSMAARDSSSNTDRYVFLKSLCDLLCSLGVHLSEVWLHISNPPPNFAVYLDALREFFSHPSLHIRSETAQVLLSFSTNSSIKKNSIVMERMPAILMMIPRTMEKVGSLSDTASPTYLYSRTDYESEHEFLQDYTRLKDRCSRLIRENMDCHFDVLSSLVSNWVNGRCVREAAFIPATEWDSMKKFITHFLQSVYALDLATPEVDAWLSGLFTNVFNCLAAPASPEVSSELLSILSAFFIVFQTHPDRIPDTIALLRRFLSIEIPSAEPNSPETGAIVSLKRHCINLLLKLVNSSSSVIKPYLSLVVDLVRSVSTSLTKIQQATLVQVLAAVSNLAEEPAQQRDFLEYALREVVIYFQSAEFLMCCSSSQEFFQYIGASSPIPVGSSEDPFLENRRKLKSNLCALEGALSQVAVPEGRSNPLFELLMPSIRNIFQFVSCFNSVYSPQALASIHVDYGTQILEMSAGEKQSIIYSQSNSDSADEQPNASSAPDAVGYMRRLLMDVGDYVQNVVGLCGAKLSRDFYALPDASALVLSVFRNADSVPDYRLRYWLKRGWSRLVSSCPAEQAAVVTPVVCALTRHMQELLTSRWAAVENLDDAGDVTEEELLSQQMVAILSREFADMLRLFVFGPGLMVKEDSKRHPSELMTPLCLESLKDAGVLEPFVVAICSLVNCPDSKSVMKVLQVARTIFGTCHSVFDTQMASYVLVHCIRGLQVNGSDEEVCGPLLGLSFSVYAWLRPAHPALVEILGQVPNSSSESIQEFDTKVLAFAQSNENIVEKNKRDLMRKILKPVIALKVGEQFRRPVYLRPLRQGVAPGSGLNPAVV